MDIQKLDQTYVANTYARFPVTIVKGKGSFSFPGWPGGKMDITVDMNTCKLIIKSVE